MARAAYGTWVVLACAVALLPTVDAARTALTESTRLMDRRALVQRQHAKRGALDVASSESAAKGAIPAAAGGGELAGHGTVAPSEREALEAAATVRSAEAKAAAAVIASGNDEAAQRVYVAEEPRRLPSREGPRSGEPASPVAEGKQGGFAEAPLAVFALHLAIPAAVLLAAGALLLARLPLPKRPELKEKVSLPPPRPPEVPAGLQVRRWASSLPVLGSEELERRLPSRKGYDCLICQPQVELVAVRLRGRVAAPPYVQLAAPLSGRPCLFYRTSAAEVRLEGVCAPAAAFKQAFCDFELELATESTGAEGTSGADGGLPPARVRVRGRDVMLFCMVGGRRRETVPLEGAPERLRDFVLANRSSGLPAIADPSGTFDFSECLLEVGAAVTCIGGLKRTETGDFELVPLEPAAALEGAKGPEEAALQVPALLSALGLLAPKDAGGCQVGRVLVSDDPELCGKRSSAVKEVRILNSRSCGLG